MKCTDRGEKAAELRPSNPPLSKATPVASLWLGGIGIFCDIACLFSYFSVNRLTISIIFAVIGTLTGLSALIRILCFIDHYRFSGMGVFALILSIAAFNLGAILLITDILITTNIYAFFTALINNIKPQTDSLL